jgi:hypothetical protein
MIGIVRRRKFVLIDVGRVDGPEGGSSNGDSNRAKRDLMVSLMGRNCGCRAGLKPAPTPSLFMRPHHAPRLAQAGRPADCRIRTAGYKIACALQLKWR